MFERVARLAAARRAVRLQRLRLQPHDRGAARRHDAEPERRRAHAPLRAGGQPHRDPAGRRRDDPDLVGDEVRVGRADRRRRARGRGAVRRVRPASRSTTSRSSSSTSRGSPERLRPDRAALRPVERERRSRTSRSTSTRRSRRAARSSSSASAPGRIAIPTALAGVHVIGVDSSAGNAGGLRRAGTGGRRRGAARPAARRPAPAAGGRARPARDVSVPLVSPPAGRRRAARGAPRRARAAPARRAPRLRRLHAVPRGHRGDARPLDRARARHRRARRLGSRGADAHALGARPGRASRR